MEILFLLGKSIAYFFGIVFLLVLIYFAVLNLLMFVAKISGSVSMKDNMYNTIDKSKNSIVAFFYNTKIVLTSLSVVFVVIFSYALLSGIQKPIEFEEVKQKRFVVVAERLRDIREVQVVYKSKYLRYCSNIDSLIQFMKQDSVMEISKKGDIEDSLAVARGEVRWDTAYVGIVDKLMFDKKLTAKFNIDSLKYIPFSGGEVFKMGSAKILTGSKVVVPVFEAKAENKQILKDLDRQLIINLNDEMNKKSGFPGLQVGSLTEANNNAGNWE
ncbi:MAG: hypothetical protein IPO21_12930 [Bacteroidales bacterium]|nr:hypothetical protein [Bacteroidales bacterium]